MTILFLYYHYDITKGILFIHTCAVMPKSGTHLFSEIIHISVMYSKSSQELHLLVRIQSFPQQPTFKFQLSSFCNAQILPFSAFYILYSLSVYILKVLEALHWSFTATTSIWDIMYTHVTIVIKLLIARNVVHLVFTCTKALCCMVFHS